MPSGAARLDDVEHDRAGAGAFDDDVGLERAEIADVIGGAESRTSSGLGPSLARSSTCTSSPRCAPISAASKPTGPAPVTSATRGCQDGARLPMRSICSQALATTLVGSSSTPSVPSAGSSLMTKSGSTRNCSLP